MSPEDIREQARIRQQRRRDKRRDDVTQGRDAGVTERDQRDESRMSRHTDPDRDTDSNPDEDWVGNCAPRCAKGGENLLGKSEQEESVGEIEGNEEEQEVLGESSPHTTQGFVKKLEEWKPLVSIWQKLMCKVTKTSPQPHLPDKEFEMLKQYGYRTRECGQLILPWTMENWATFASHAAGAAGHPPAPSVPFLCAYQNVAFDLWLHSPTGYEQVAASIKASNKLVDLLEQLKSGYADTWVTVREQLKYRGGLVKTPQGWQVCDQVFHYMKEIEKKYSRDEGFRKLLQAAAAGSQ